MLLLTMLFASTAQPEPMTPPPVPPDEIIVTGKHLPSPAIVNNFVRAVATPVMGQLAVFRQPICPNVVGLAPGEAAKVLDRMRTVAKSAGIRLANQPCDLNLTLIVAADGRAFMQEVHRTRGRTLEALTPDQRRSLLQHPGPAWAWRTIGKHTIDGKSNQATDPSLTTSGGSAGGGATGMTAMQTRGASLLKMQIRQDVGDAYVVIDEKSLDGKSAVQIADYTMMRGVAGAQPSSDAIESGSILALFEASGPGPQSLNYLDLAFLTTVYELPMDQSFSQQLSIIASRINKADTSKRARSALSKESGD